jgi:hypothetical protein
LPTTTVRAVDFIMAKPTFRGTRGASAAIFLLTVAVCAMMLSMAMHWCCL